MSTHTKDLGNELETVVEREGKLQNRWLRWWTSDRNIYASPL